MKLEPCVRCGGERQQAGRSICKACRLAELAEPGPRGCRKCRKYFGRIVCHPAGIPWAALPCAYYLKHRHLLHA